MENLLTLKVFNGYHDDKEQPLIINIEGSSKIEGRITPILLYKSFSKLILTN